MCYIVLFLNFLHQSHAVLKADLICCPHLSGSGIAYAVENFVEYIKQLVKLLLALSQIYCISIYDMMSMETDYVLRTLDIDPDKQLRRKNINQEFGQALRTILKVSGVKQTALAGYLGCTKQYIQLLITGKRHCAKETRHKICVYLGLPEDHFDYIYVMYAKEEEDL